MLSASVPEEPHSSPEESLRDEAFGNDCESWSAAI